jgi:hypothetical protein
MFNKTLLVFASLAFALAACSSSPSSKPLSTSSTQATPSLPPSPRFAAVNRKYLPGTSRPTWFAFSAVSPPSPATGEEVTMAPTLATSIALFGFASQADATSFYSAPPPAIPTFVSGALGYSPLNASTGIAAPSRALDLRSCPSEGHGPSLLPSGQCSNGNSSFSIGVSVIFQRGDVVGFVAFLTSNNPTKGNPAQLSNISKYVKSTVNLLAQLRLS